MPFDRIQGELHADGVALAEIARQFGTPCYVYSWADIADRYRRLEAAFAGHDHRICYAVKANGNLSILRRLAKLGAGFDIVSGGELERVLRAGGDARRVVFSGVGKAASEIDFALERDIGCFNVESAPELDRLGARAEAAGKTARIAIRVNPDVDANTHPYIATGLKESKFGVPAPLALALCRQAHATEQLEVVGLDCHIGSQIADIAPFDAALTTLLDLVDTLGPEGIDIQHLDIGGGYGIRYQDEDVMDVGELARLVKVRLATRKLKLVLEPGRCLVAEAGVLLARVEYLKEGATPEQPGFAVVDAAMNDLIRPPLYDAWHDIEPVAPADAPLRTWDVVGPICESGDFLGRGRELALHPGALLAVRTAGAYGFALSSNYNSRCRSAEVLVEDGACRLVRRRETLDDMLSLETCA